MGNDFHFFFVLVLYPIKESLNEIREIEENENYEMDIFDSDFFLYIQEINQISQKYPFHNFHFLKSI